MVNIYVLHNGHEYGVLTLDCEKRLLAAGKYISTLPDDKKIFFVGGCGLNSGRIMVEYWKRKFPEINKNPTILGKSKTTYGNLKEIKQSLEFSSVKSFVVITSDYHVKRVEDTIKRLSISNKCRVLSAEDSLGLKRSSIFKFISESFLRVCQKVDKTQSIIEAVRRFTYRKRQ